MTKSLSEKDKKLIQMLKKLEKAWTNTNLWLFVAEGQINIMQGDKDGKPAMTDRGGVDPEYIVDSIVLPGADGGGW